MLSWFFYYCICGCNQARSAYSHSEDLILVFISVFWVTILFKHASTSPSLPWICFLLFKLTPWPIFLPFPLTCFVLTLPSKIYNLYILLPLPPVSVVISKSGQSNFPAAARQSILFISPISDQLSSPKVLSPKLCLNLGDYVLPNIINSGLSYTHSPNVID